MFRLLSLVGFLRLLGIRFTTIVVIGLFFAMTYGVNLDHSLSQFISWIEGAQTKVLSLEKEPKSASRLVQIWTSTRQLSAQENAENHFRKHKDDFTFKTVEQYVAAATDFLHHPPSGAQTKKQADGDIVVFHPPTARFAVMRADGTPRTYFKLNPDIHGYPSNQAYFDAQ